MSIMLSVVNEEEDDESSKSDDYLFDDEQVTIGRAEENDLTLPDPKRVVSSEHAMLERSGDTYQLIDRGSKNFTYIGEDRLPPGEPYTLREGDTFRIGDFRIEYTQLDYDPQVSQSASDGGETVFEAEFENPFEEPIDQLVDALAALTDSYDEVAPQRRDDALAEAVEAADPPSGVREAVRQTFGDLGLSPPDTLPSSTESESNGTAIGADSTEGTPTPESTEPESAGLESTEPEFTGPESAEPEFTGPESAEPESTEPDLTEPESTEPESTEPEPESTEPDFTEPEPTEPGTETRSANQSDMADATPMEGAASSSAAAGEGRSRQEETVETSVLNTLAEALAKVLPIPWRFRHEFIGQPVTQDPEPEFLYEGDGEIIMQHLTDPSISEEEREERLGDVEEAAEFLKVHQVAMLNGYKASVMNGAEELLEQFDPEEHREAMMEENVVFEYVPMLASPAVLERIRVELGDLYGDWSSAEQRIFRPAFTKAYLSSMAESRSDDQEEEES